MFKSWYGHALDSADAGYKAGTLGYQAKVKYTFENKLSTTASLTQYRQDFDSSQTDINAVIAYKYRGFNIAAKGIWVLDNAQVDGNRLDQYRVIVSRKF